MSTYKNIPTNIISGFLGAGKTTVVQFLLKHKPRGEVWAVVVNEFGQIGIDGALLKNDSVEIKEIAGGCLCCVGSQSLSVGLNQIIRTIKPQRIIIEPTGLGHPARLVESLTGEFYHSVLDLKAIINLLDARQLKDDRYTTNETFIDQSNLADILVASKLDTYCETDKELFFDYASSFEPAKVKVAMIEQGRLPLEWLDMSRSLKRFAEFPEFHSHSHHQDDQTCEIINENTADWFVVEGHADNFYSLGWRINKSLVFNKEKLLKNIKDLFESSDVERVKGVVFTESGCLAINYTPNESQVNQVTASDFSVFEVIATEPLNLNVVNLSLKSCLM
ncbi:MAG: GTP-binding protein [Gammaproteobacteria bacterium]|nr:GTP-binding protein [Gammaproteobacteria bacterium]